MQLCPPLEKGFLERVVLTRVMNMQFMSILTLKHAQNFKYVPNTNLFYRLLPAKKNLLS